MTEKPKPTRMLLRLDRDVHDALNRIVVRGARRGVPITKTAFINTAVRYYIEATKAAARREDAT